MESFNSKTRWNTSVITLCKIVFLFTLTFATFLTFFFFLNFFYQISTSDSAIPKDVVCQLAQYSPTKAVSSVHILQKDAPVARVPIMLGAPPGFLFHRIKIKTCKCFFSLHYFCRSFTCEHMNTLIKHELQNVFF